jgi:tetratricopeptide (TPR) repeat protein
VPGYSRRQLKEDKFAATAQGAAEWATGHRKLVIWVLGAIVIVVLATTGFLTWRSRQMDQANDELAGAMRTFNAPLGAQAAQQDPNTPTFNSAAERAKAAAKQFQEIADKHSMVAPGKVARFMYGVALLQQGDKANAEQEIKKAADSGDKDLASLAKMSLASLYRDSNRQADAAKIYKELADHPTASVSKATAQLALADMYEKTDPQQATAIYQQVQKDNPQSMAARVAAQKLAGAK